LDVRVLARNPETVHLDNRVEVAAGDVRVPSTLVSAANGVDTIVSAVQGLAGAGGVSPRTVDRDGNKNLVDAAASARCDFVMMSMVGASPDNPMELARMKYAAEEYALASGVPTTVVRSTAFAELWVELLRQTSKRSGRPMVFGHGQNPINFVSVEDVGALLEMAVTNRDLRGSTLEIGGPENMSFDQLARAIQMGSDNVKSPRHLNPTALLVMAATVGNLRPQLGRQMRTSLLMDTMDLRYDSMPARSAFPGLPCTTVSEVITRERSALAHPG
jgi:uncharacterized protein YbjT (DUF2867 family)